MKKTIISLLLAALCGFSGFAKEFKVNIVPDTYWAKRSPQCAVWVEDENGRYIGTLFVTNSASKKKWIASPKDGRPDSLPVWYKAAGLNPANPQTVDLDAVSSATPKKSVTVSQKLHLETGKKYFVYAEANQSFDYNEVWTKKNSGVNGQPSVIYRGEFIVKDSELEIELSLIGTGSVDGSSGEVKKDDLEKLTTADKIVSHIYVVITN